MVCPGGCKSNVDDTGLRIERTSTLRRQGQVFDARDVVRNTGSQPRQVVLAYLNDQRWGKTHVQLPGESARTGRRNAVVELPRAAVATLAVEKPFDPSYQSEADALHGALTMAPAADAVVFTDKPAAFLTRYTFTLAPGASKSITFSYAGHATLAGVAALAKETEEALTRALVPTTPPADGTPKAPEENPLP